MPRNNLLHGQDEVSGGSRPRTADMNSRQKSSIAGKNLVN